MSKPTRKEIKRRTGWTGVDWNSLTEAAMKALTMVMDQLGKAIPEKMVRDMSMKEANGYYEKTEVLNSLAAAYNQLDVSQKDSFWEEGK